MQTKVTIFSFKYQRPVNCIFNRCKYFLISHFLSIKLIVIDSSGGMFSVLLFLLLLIQRYSFCAVFVPLYWMRLCVGQGHLLTFAIFVLAAAIHPGVPRAFQVRCSSSSILLVMHSCVRFDNHVPYLHCFTRFRAGYVSIFQFCYRLLHQETLQLLLLKCLHQLVLQVDDICKTFFSFSDVVFVFAESFRSDTLSRS